MREPGLFLSILLFAALLLSACGAEETQVPGTDVPPITAEVTATEDISGTATEPAMTESPTETPGVPVTGDVNPARLSNQLDFSVWSQDGEQVGDVEDMVLNLDDSSVEYVVVGTGGFLEIGEKEVLVPWELLDIQTGTGDATGGQENAFILQTDVDTFRNAPDVDLAINFPELGQPADEWDLDIRNYWEGGGTTNTPAPDGTAVPEMTATGTGQDAAQATATGDAGQAQALQGVILASDFLDSTVTVQDPGTAEQPATEAPEATADPNMTATPATDGDTGADTGMEDIEVAIDDVIVDTDAGDLLYIVVNSTFDDGERWIPIPLSMFQWDAANNGFILNTDATTIQDAPFFQEGQYPDTTVDGWNSEFDTFWQNNSAGTTP